MNPFKKLAGQAAIYGLSSMVGRAVNFLLVPFYTAQSVLSTEEFGQMSDIYALVAFFNIIFCFGMETTYFRYSKKGGEEKTFNNTLSFLLLFTFITSIFIALNATSIVNYLNYPGKEVYIYTLTGVLFIDAIVSIPFARLRHQNKAIKFASIRLGNIFLNIGFNILFLVILKNTSFYDPTLGIGYVFIANLLANLFFIPMLISTLKTYRFTLEKAYLKELIVYAYPIIFTGFAQMINEVIDRRLLLSILPKGIHGDYSNIEAVGIYSACYKFSMFMSLATQSFRYAAEPFFFSKADKKDAPETYALVLKWFIITTSVLFISVSLYRYFIASFLLSSEDYRTGLIIVPILLLANMFLGIYYNQSIWYKVKDKTQWGTIIAVIGAIITLAGNWFLIPIYGYIGSAIATLLCYASISIISYVVGHKYYPIPYNIKSALFYIIYPTIIVVIAHYLYNENSVRSFLIASVLFLLYLGSIIVIEKKNLPFKK